MAGSKHQYRVKCAAGQQRCSKGDVTIVILRLHEFSLTDKKHKKGSPGAGDIVVGGTGVAQAPFFIAFR